MKPTMDFFEHQEDAHRQTRRLVVLFIAAVIMVVVAVNLAVLVIFYGAELKAGAEDPFQNFRPDVLLWVTLGTLAVMSTGSLFKIAQLSGGGDTVAQLLGGRPVDPSTTDGAERRLLNVVEEMALASGTPVPTVYVLDKEPGINAFAAGFSPQRAVVAVTRGTLERLDRDELQGVIAHEFSHLLNGDTRLNLKLMGIVHGILVIGLLGYWILRSGAGSGSSGSRKKGGGGGIVLFGLALLVIGYVGVFFGKLIKSAVSRQREFLADASAVQFTRNPDGIAGALKKIGGLASDEAGSRLRNPNAEQASHLFFGNGVGKSLFAWLETHPPLAERIRRLDPSFDGTFPKLAPTAVEERAAALRQPAKPAAAAARGPIPIPLPAGGAFGGGRALGGALGGAAGAGGGAAVVLAGAAALSSGSGGSGGGGAVAGRAAATRALDPDDVTATVGSPTARHLAYIAALMDALPPDLARDSRDPSTARAVVAALLLDPDPTIRGRQLDLVAATGDPTLDSSVRRLATAAEGFPTEARLPLLDLAVPALRRLSARQYVDFKALVDALSAADDRLSLFEFTLRHLLMRHLEPSFKKRPPAAVQYYSLGQLGGEIGVLLSALAWAGAGAEGEGGGDGEREAAAAFDAGLGRLAGAVDASTRLALLPRGDCGLDRLDAALDKLAASAPRLRQQLLAAAAAAIAQDGRVTLDEGELLRAVADALDCPLPPLLPGEALAGAA